MYKYIIMYLTNEDYYSVTTICMFFSDSAFEKLLRSVFLSVLNECVCVL